MAQPLVQGDKIQGQCPGHQIPSASGAPAPAGPLPFSAPLTDGPRVVGDDRRQGRRGPRRQRAQHARPTSASTADAVHVPTTQKGTVMSGSPTVTAGGKPIATSSSQVTMCMQVPGQPVATVTNVTVA